MMKPFISLSEVSIKFSIPSTKQTNNKQHQNTIINNNINLNNNSNQNILILILFICIHIFDLEFYR